jgi:hypothetical protein
MFSDNRRKKEMKTALKNFAVLLILIGVIWVLQGFNILPGSFMSGNLQWAINGAISIVVGAGIFWFARRK